ncbi:MAG TPA: hypothetical protein ENJ45_01385, partial [Phaeodactylibacter sp.]|nr:hypothetical protein [Phaeodactylibacter sp.]
MGKDKLDKFIKDKISEHPSEIDVEKLWKGILEKQKEEDQPKAWLWLLPYFLVFSFVLTASVLGYVFWLAPNVEASQVAPTATTHQQKQSTSSHTDTKDVGQALANDSASKLNSQKDKLKAQKSEDLPDFQNDRILSSPTYPSNTAPYGKQDTPQSKPTKTPVKKQTDDSASYLPLLKGNSKQTIQKNQTLEPGSIQDFNTTPSIAQNDRTAISYAYAPISIISLSAKVTHKHSNPSLLPKLKPITPAKKRSRLKAPLSIESYIGYGFASKKLKTNSPAASDYIAIRNQHESPRQVLATGLLLRYPFNSGIYLRSGLAYEQVNELFDWQQTKDTTFFDMEAPESITFHKNGSIDTLYGNISIQMHIHQRQIYNRYRSLHLPILFGYQSDNNHPLRFFADVGLLVNLYFFPRGEILDADGSSIIDISKSDHFKKNIGLSLNAGIGLSYQVNQQHAIWCSARYYHELQAITTDDYTLTQKFHRLILQMGLR